MGLYYTSTHLSGAGSHLDVSYRSYGDDRLAKVLIGPANSVLPLQTGALSLTCLAPGFP